MNEVIASTLTAKGAAGFRPKVAVVLGSGLGGFAEDVKAIATIPYGELPDFPATGVSSHAGQLVLGHVGPTPVAVLQSRWRCATESRKPFAPWRRWAARPCC